MQIGGICLYTISYYFFPLRQTAHGIYSVDAVQKRSDEPPQTRTVFSNGFHGAGVSSPLHNKVDRSESHALPDSSLKLKNTICFLN